MNLEQRVARLECENRRLRLGAFITIAIATIAGIRYFDVPQPSTAQASDVTEGKQDAGKKQPPKPRTLAAPSFTPKADAAKDMYWVDKDGNVVMMLGVSADGSPFLYMRTKDSQKMVGVHPDVIDMWEFDGGKEKARAYYTASQASLHDKSTEESALLHATYSGVTLANSKLKAAAYINVRGPSFTYDKSSVDLDIHQGWARIKVSDPDGRAVLSTKKLDFLAP